CRRLAGPPLPANHLQAAGAPVPPAPRPPNRGEPSAVRLSVCRWPGDAIERVDGGPPVRLQPRAVGRHGEFDARVSELAADVVDVGAVLEVEGSVRVP